MDEKERGRGEEEKGGKRDEKGGWIKRKTREGEEK